MVIFSEGTKSLLAAMNKHGVHRLICITGIGDSKGHGGFLYDKVVLPIFLKRIYDDKDREEDLIRKSDRDWIIVRPVPYEWTGNGKVSSPHGPDWGDGRADFQG